MAFKRAKWAIAVNALGGVIFFAYAFNRFSGISDDLRDAAKNDVPPCKLEKDGTGCAKPRPPTSERSPNP